MTDEEKKQLKEAFNRRIGQRIAVLRSLAKLTQEQLAERAGLQRTHVGRIEAGRYEVTGWVLEAIAKALGLTVDIIDPALQDLAPLKRLTPPEPPQQPEQ